jgi:hypothetical protein
VTRKIGASECEELLCGEQEFLICILGATLPDANGQAEAQKTCTPYTAFSHDIILITLLRCDAAGKFHLHLSLVSPTTILLAVRKARDTHHSVSRGANSKFRDAECPQHITVCSPSRY